VILIVKRTLILLVAFSILFTLGCHKDLTSPKQIDYAKLPLLNIRLFKQSDIEMSLDKEKYPPSIQEMDLKIINKSSSTLYSGIYCDFEVYKNGHWHTFPYDNKVIGDVGTKTIPNSIFDLKVSTHGLKYPFKKGRYRLTKKFDKGRNGKKITISAEFEIK
jgi:hypothetical protein